MYWMMLGVLFFNLIYLAAPKFADYGRATTDDEMVTVLDGGAPIPPRANSYDGGAPIPPR